MKKLAWIFAAAAIVLFSGCNKDKGNDAQVTEVGKWYGYNPQENGTANKNDVAIVLELKADNTADLMLTAWGSRWQGTYTYDGQVVKLKWNKFLFRGNAGELGDDAVSPLHLYEWWTVYDKQEVFQNPDQFGSVIEIKFTYSGNKGTLDIANKPCPAERQ